MKRQTGLLEIIDRLKQLGYHQWGGWFERVLSKSEPYKKMTVTVVRKNGKPCLIWYCGTASIGPFTFNEAKEALGHHRKIVAAFKKHPMTY
jgi:hypothetical protein